MVNKENNIQTLEKAAENYRRKSYNAAMIPPLDGPTNEYGGSVIDAFKAGAEWQYQKDRREFAKIKAKTWCEGFDAHNQQMLKDAVEGEVIYDLGGFFRIKSEAIDGAKYKVGSWVKLIIVKED